MAAQGTDRLTQLRLWRDSLKTRVAKLQANKAPPETIQSVCTEYMRVCEEIQREESRAADDARASASSWRARRRRRSPETQQPAETTPVTLHIYDLTDGALKTANKVTKGLLALGAFHAGVEVLGREYFFACDGGIVTCRPGGNTGHSYREAIDMGSVAITRRQLRRILRRMQPDWPASSYHLMSRNCCHFADAFCQELGVGPIPAWVNRLANTGDAVDGFAQKVVGGSISLTQKIVDALGASVSSISSSSRPSSSTHIE